MKKIILEVLGLSYSQTQAGAYALILTVKGTDNRIPIIIGSFEAQSIAIQLEEIITARPLTHDLFLSVCTRYEIEMKEVLIYKLEEGVFFSRLVLEKDGKTELIESRTSDAVALALRFKCPIYTTEVIVESAGIILEMPSKSSEEGKSDKKTKSENIFDLSVEDLENMMQAAIEDENYELASRLRDEINKRKENQ